jgi:hypothetical protein
MSGDWWSRRRLLRALGGCAAALPLLEAGSARGTSAIPRRLVILQWTNGVLPDYWPPAPTAGQPFALSETLSPLERHRAKVLILGGLQIAAPLSTGHWSLPLLLTGSAGLAGLTAAGPPLANAISVDQYVASRLARRAPTRFKSLELSAAYIDEHHHHRAVSYRGPAVGGRPAANPPEIDPRRVWRRLFAGQAGDGFSAERLARIQHERRSVLDHVLRDLTALSVRLGRADRRKIEAHLDSARQLERELFALPQLEPPAAVPSCPPAPPPGRFVPPDQPSIDQLVSLQLDLLALALRCDLVRVATVMLINSHNGGIGFPFLGSAFAGRPDPEGEFDHHGIAHRGGPKKSQVDRWWIGQLAALLDRLEAVPEAGGTLLDSCAVLFANNMGDGASHSVAGLPWILAGSCQGTFATGRYLVHPGWDPQRPTVGCPPTNAVLVALANAVLAGLDPPLASFGDLAPVGELPGLRG